jgi:hypothetical protein
MKKAKLANDGQDTRAIQHYQDTVAPSRLADTPCCLTRASRTSGRTNNKFFPFILVLKQQRNTLS